MHALIMSVVCVIAVSCTLGYILFSKAPKSESNVFVGCSNANRYSVSKDLHEVHKAAHFTGEHKKY